MASGLLSLAWLLPNHTKPWTSFHSDAWIGAVLGVVSAVVIAQAGQPKECHGLTGVVAILAPLPLLQYCLGFFPFAGQAWVAVAYILAFLLALMVGAQWQEWQPTWMGDILFSAIGIAAITSVALQLQQWLQPMSAGSLDVWTLGSDGSRPYANMAQPNQLATLLLWGLLACGWGIRRKHLGRISASLAAAFVLIGLALTQSRTGALGLFALVLAAWLWRRLWGAKNVFWYVLGLAFFYVLLLGLLEPLRSALMLSAPQSMAERLGHELRPELWRLLLDAAWQRPLFGYGWNQVLPAQIAVAERHSALHYPFFQSHNQFLDLILWTGIPLGLLLSGCLLAWLVIAACRVRRPEDALYLLFVVVIGIHAMLELPLHYAYFLLPAGLIMGSLNASLRIWPLCRPARVAGSGFLLGTWCVTVILLVLIARDYFRVEESFAALQLERSQIQGNRQVEAPQVLLLTDQREIQRFMKFEPTDRASSAEIQWARDVTVAWPSARSFMTLAILLGINQNPEEAHEWLVKMCRIIPADQCASAPSRWAHAVQLHPQLAAVGWPPKLEGTKTFHGETRQ